MVGAGLAPALGGTICRRKLLNAPLDGRGRTCPCIGRNNMQEKTATGPLRVAIIGYGLAGSVFHAPLAACTPGMTVAAIVTNHPERREQARRDFPRAAILSTAQDLWRNASDYDLVVVAAPT